MRTNTARYVETEPVDASCCNLASAGMFQTESECCKELRLPRARVVQICAISQLALKICNLLVVVVAPIQADLAPLFRRNPVVQSAVQECFPLIARLIRLRICKSVQPVSVSLCYARANMARANVHMQMKQHLAFQKRRVEAWYPIMLGPWHENAEHTSVVYPFNKAASMVEQPCNY